MYIYIHTYIYTRAFYNTRLCATVYPTLASVPRSTPFSRRASSARAPGFSRISSETPTPPPSQRDVACRPPSFSRPFHRPPSICSFSQNCSSYTGANARVAQQDSSCSESGIRTRAQPARFQLFECSFFFFLKRVKIFLFSFVKLLRFDYFAA